MWVNPGKFGESFFGTSYRKNTRIVGTDHLLASSFLLKENLSVDKIQILRDEGKNKSPSPHNNMVCFLKVW